MLGNSLYEWVRRVGANLNRARLFDSIPQVADWDDVQRTLKLVRKLRRRASDPPHAGISSITATMVAQWRWTCLQNLTGAAYNPNAQASSILKSYSFGTANANGSSGGGDELFSFQQPVAGGGSATINLNNMTNLMQVSGVAIARVKGWMFQLLSATDDPTITTPVASAVTLTNIGPATPAPLDFQNGGTGLTVTLTVVGGAVTAVAIGAAGSGYPPSTAFLVVPQQAGGSGCVIAVVTNSSGVPTSVVFVTGAGGTGYSAATVPTTPAGQYLLNSGGVHEYFDPLNVGFCDISATACNVKCYNMDPVNTATLQISAAGATT